MNIFTDLNHLPKIKNLVLTVGTFDGVHLGHNELISLINQRAKEINGESGLMTFHPHPRMILQPKSKHSIRLLTTIEERIEKLEEAGLDNLFIVPFSVDFANMPAEDYVADFLVAQFHPKHLVIGYDHQFGKGREGNYALLEASKEKFDYTIEQINQQKIEDITYSSTNIRNLLLDGDVSLANKLLGYSYKINGIIAHGDKRGRQMGFPTANIRVLDETKLIPAKGVYAVKTTVNNKTYNGMLNIGIRPTFDGHHKTIENHIFNFNENIYGYKVSIEFVDRIRNEQKFENLEELSKQLQKDEIVAKQLLNNNL